jgi:hypothetical protein
MGQVPSTGRPLKALRNSSGLKKEIQHSLKFHQEGIPLLISEQLLRSRNLGQLDLVRMRKINSAWIVEIAEVKSSVVGIEMIQRGQKVRIFGAQKFISSLFGYPSKTLFFYD